MGTGDNSYGHAKVARILLEHGADINLQDKKGWTALMLACFFEQDKAAKLLLEHGADVNIKNRKGKTALDIGYKNAKILQLFEKIEKTQTRRGI